VLLIIINGSTALMSGLGRLFSFLILYTVGKTPWTGDQPDTGPIHTQDNTNKINTNIHASSWIRTHDPSTGKAEDNSCLRQRGNCHRLRE
jgi:hypothetical protein